MEGAYKTCSRCGGIGTVSRGQVINGVCYGCHGKGKIFVGLKDKSNPRKGTQYVIVDAEGHHLALNTDHGFLEQIFSTIPGAVKIEEFHK